MSCFCFLLAGVYPITQQQRPWDRCPEQVYRQGTAGSTGWFRGQHCPYSDMVQSVPVPLQPICDSIQCECLGNDLTVEGLPCTVQPVLKDHPPWPLKCGLSIKCQGRWSDDSLVKLSWNVGPSVKNVWSIKTGDLSWQWSLKTGFTVICKHGSWCQDTTSGIIGNSAVCCVCFYCFWVSDTCINKVIWVSSL